MNALALKHAATSDTKPMIEGKSKLTAHLVSATSLSSTLLCITHRTDLLSFTTRTRTQTGGCRLEWDPEIFSEEK